MRFLVFALLVVATFSCKKRNSGSTPLVFSAKSSGYLWNVKAQIKMSNPSDAAIKSIVSSNIESLALDHPADQDVAAKFKSLSNPTLATSIIHEGREKLHIGDVRHWIQEQLKYSIYVDGDRIALSLDPLSVNFKETAEGSGLYDYTATVVLVTRNEGAIEKLASREILLPLEPMMLHYNLYSEDKNFNLAASMNKERKVSPCFNPDGGSVAPYNFFDYFNPYDNKDCFAKSQSYVQKLAKPSLTKMASKPVYPEYQEMFRDGQLDILIGATPYDEADPKKYPNEVLEAIKSLKFTKIKEIDADQYVFEKVISQNPSKIVRIHYIYRSHSTEIATEFQKGIFGKADIVFFNGHSGYGSYLFNILDPKFGLPEKKYQLYILQSCSSFTYGTGTVLGSKAVRDFDTKAYYSDLIVTANTAMFTYFAPITKTVIAFFEDAFENYKVLRLDDFTFQKILAYIDSKQDEKYNAIYTVAGEEYNVFDPKKDPETIKFPESDSTDLLAMYDQLIELRKEDADFLAEITSAIVRKSPQLTPELFKHLNYTKEHHRYAMYRLVAEIKKNPELMTRHVGILAASVRETETDPFINIQMFEAYIAAEKDSSKVRSYLTDLFNRKKNENKNFNIRGYLNALLDAKVEMSPEFLSSVQGLMNPENASVVIPLLVRHYKIYPKAVQTLKELIAKGFIRARPTDMRSGSGYGSGRAYVLSVVEEGDMEALVGGILTLDLTMSLLEEIAETESISIEMDQLIARAPVETVNDARSFMDAIQERFSVKNLSPDMINKIVRAAYQGPAQLKAAAQMFARAKINHPQIVDRATKFLFGTNTEYYSLHFEILPYLAMMNPDPSMVPQIQKLLPKAEGSSTYRLNIFNAIATIQGANSEAANLLRDEFNKAQLRDQVFSSFAVPVDSYLTRLPEFRAMFRKMGEPEFAEKDLFSLYGNDYGTLTMRMKFFALVQTAIFFPNEESGLHGILQRDYTKSSYGDEAKLLRAYLNNVRRMRTGR